MRKLTVVLSSALFACSVSVNANEGFYLGPSISGYYLDSDRYVGGGEEAIVGGLNIGYRFFNDWALELALKLPIRISSWPSWISTTGLVKTPRAGGPM